MQKHQRTGRLKARWAEFYSTPGGPLLAWLQDEAIRQGWDLPRLAKELGVAEAYLRQLELGVTKAEEISDRFAVECGVFLRVPMVVVLVVAGRLRLVDFICASDLDRWIEDHSDDGEPADAQLRCGTNLGTEELSLLPAMVRELREAALIHHVRSQVN